MNFSRLIAEYIQEAWRKARRVLNGPQAQEELLSGASLSFFEAGTANPVVVYADPDCFVALPNPVIADSFGEFPAIFVDASQPRPGFSLHRSDGGPIMRVEDGAEYFGPSKKPQWF